jgi:hypothetical protein
MNRKTKILTIFILGFLVASIYFSALTQAIVASDILEVNAGSYVKGKLLYSNSSHTDILGAYANITVEDIYNCTTYNIRLMEISVNFDIQSSEGDALGFGVFDTFSYTSLIFADNRSLALPAARLILANNSFWGEVSVLHTQSLDGMMVQNDTRLIIDGTTYKFSDIYPGHPQEDVANDLMITWFLLNLAFGLAFIHTLLAISPTANVGDTINQYPPTLSGTVIDKPTVTTSAGKVYDTIHVGYTDTFVLGFGTLDDVDCFYEASSGLLIRSLEKDTVSGEQFEFQPSEVKIKKSGLLPFPFAGVVVSILAIGLVVIFVRKKK